ncbi:M1 family metallopeptidase [Paractinoplanes rishiriensis]|uniref:Aminopeptidase N n=1 Tax=Paractinoplanes rishiriensis TaxID=1050105 RepID=A0A919JV04_9ACTN|nr:M1 family metallopeptidase [Actinoplanes rishiriensis]GIE93769.1 metallopeptidase [Actinoplanes rishiriensis]
MDRWLRAAVAVLALLTGCAETPAAPAIPVPARHPGTSVPVADPLYPGHGNPGLDVLHYDLDLAWDPRAGTLTGTATLRIRPTVDAASVRLDFQPYEMIEVEVDGVAVPAGVTGEKLTVPVAVTRDRPVTLVVGYRGRPRTTPMPSHRTDTEPLGLTVTRDGGLWTMQEPYGAYTWYPANDHPSDEALYDIAVTVPAGWTAIAGGTPAGVDGRTFRYTSADPVATYLQTLAVGRYRKLTATGPGGVPLTYWYRPGVDERLLPALRKSPSHLSFLVERFGPYPFPTGGVVLVDSASAMETQQMITMGGRVRADRFDQDLLHEFAHQWFGNSVTLTHWADLWLNEGWAMYAQLLYDQSLDGYSDDELEKRLRERDAAPRKRLGPPAWAKPGYFAESNVYLCPAAMLKEVHDRLGDRRFFALATAWVQTQRNTQQDRASFTTFVNRQTGEDFTALIDAWLDSPTTPA